jgi:2-polyprenyl-3-methyl-5-hydroxy-6-metoxy-1,4-benzoquinol methylase
LLGIELIDEYIHIAKQYFPVIKMDISRIENLNIFSNKSFDIVMALDVLEHIEYNNAIHLIKRMTDIARKKVIIYTPKEFHSNEQHICNVWNIQGEFITQKHLSWIPHKVLEDMGFKITFPYPDDNTLAILILPMVMGDVKE